MKQELVLKSLWELLSAPIQLRHTHVSGEWRVSTVTSNVWPCFCAMGVFALWYRQLRLIVKALICAHAPFCSRCLLSRSTCSVTVAGCRNDTLLSAYRTGVPFALHYTGSA